MATARPGFQATRGSQDVEEAASKNRADFSSLRPTNLKFEGSPSRFSLRFLDDDKRPSGDDRPNLWRGVYRHYVATVDEPKSFKGKKWPPGMFTTCRYDDGFGGHFKDCPPCDKGMKTPDGRDGTAKMRMFARAVLREQVPWTGEEPEFTDPESEEYKAHTDKWRKAKKGKLRAIRDKTHLQPVLDENGKPTGEKREAPIIYLIDQSNYLFFSHLSTIAQNRMEAGISEEDYTILDKDWLVTKTGKENKTSFNFEALPGSDELYGEKGQTVEIDGELIDLEDVLWDVRDPMVLAYYEQFIPWNVDDFLVDAAMDEHVYKWLVKGGWDEYATDDDEDEEDEKPVRKAKRAPSAQRRGPAAVDDDDEDDDEPEDSDDEDEDGPMAARKAQMRKSMKASDAAPRKRRNSAPAEDDDSDDESEDVDEDDEDFAKV